MELRWRSIVLLTTIISLEKAQSAVKQWAGDWIINWEDSRNWFEGRVPELDSFVTFPEEMRHAVGLPRTGNFRFSGFQFPANGFVALPESGKVTISSISTDQSSESRWNWQMIFQWADPEMWNTTSKAVPYMEQLPCQYDVVILPPKSHVFTVRLPSSRDIEVQEVRLADDNASLTRFEWSLMSERREFLGSRFSVKYSPLYGCENCPCQEGDISEYWEEVCDIVRPTCDVPECEYPLPVEGHCCHYCGGRITLSEKALVSRARRVTDRVLRSYANTVDWYVRFTSIGDKEILLAEKGRYMGTDVFMALEELAAALKEESIDIIGKDYSGDPMYDYRLLVALGPLFGGFLILMCLTLLLCIYFGYSFSQIWDATREVFAVMCIDKRVNGRRKKSFAFARFENVSEGNVQLAEETSHQQISSGERFENPLYRSTKRRTSKSQEKKLDLQSPVSLAALQQATELDNSEEIEMDIENL